MDSTSTIGFRATMGNDNEVGENTAHKEKSKQMDSYLQRVPQNFLEWMFNQGLWTKNFVLLPYLLKFCKE